MPPVRSTQLRLNTGSNILTGREGRGTVPAGSKSRLMYNPIETNALEETSVVLEDGAFYGSAGRGHL